MGNKIEYLQPETVAHHEIADKHREMSDEEFQALKLDIEQNGQLVAIITYRGKLVDGRHRQRALIELGIDRMKAEALPNNLSIKEVEDRVMSTENRRMDTPLQKSIRAYMYYKEHKDEMTQSDVAEKFGVARTYISLASKLETLIGSAKLRRLYELGYMYIGSGTRKKKYMNLQTILRALKTDAEDMDEPKDKLPGYLSAAFEHMSDMAKVEDLESLAAIRTRANNYINQITMG